VQPPSRLVRFGIYGILGLATEVVFTAGHTAIATRGRRIDGHTSAWMFPVYGLIQPLFEPAHDAMRGRFRAPARASAYAAGFLAVEYATGRLYRRVLGRAPWDYSHARWNLDGLIRADYAVAWALAGLALERVDDAIRPGGVRRRSK
jgi:uncharacterized membrane protein